MAQQTRLGLYGGPRPVYGSFAGKVDTTPDAFEFTDLTDQALNTVIESSEITVAGINAAAAVSFVEVGHTSGEYSLNSGAWTDLANFNIDNGDTLKLRLTTSTSNNTITSIQVTIGGVSDTWSVSTLAEVGDEGGPRYGSDRRPVFTMDEQGLITILVAVINEHQS